MKNSMKRRPARSPASAMTAGRRMPPLVVPTLASVLLISSVSMCAFMIVKLSHNALYATAFQGSGQAVNGWLQFIYSLYIIHIIY